MSCGRLKPSLENHLNESLTFITGCAGGLPGQ